jgi:anti-anti-sigma regulatory factor
MFRAEICQLATGPILTLQGRLVGAWAEQARTLVVEEVVPKGLIVDLTDVSYIDSVGEQVLEWFCSVGAKFVAKATYAAFICERLQLPLQEVVNS